MQLLRLLFLLVLASLACLAQGVGSPPQIVTMTTAPTGSCNTSQFVYVPASNLIYGCSNGAWAAMTGSGSGTVTHTCGNLTTGYVIVGAATADICIQTGAYFNGSNNLILPAGIQSGGAASGVLKLGGSSSGLVQLTVGAAAGTYTITLPNAAGTSGYALVDTNGAGQWGYAAIPTALPPNGSATGDLTGTYPAPTITTVAGTAVATVKTRGVGMVFDGGGTAIALNKIGYLPAVPYAGTIAAWDLCVDTGTATVDVFKIATGTGLPTSSITASATPAIASNNCLHSTAVSTWTTAIAAGDRLAFKVTAVSAATNISIVLTVNQ